jgi:hypothetical protein
VRSVCLERLCLAKILSALKSTACTLCSAPVPAMTVAHVPLRGIRVGPAHPLLAMLRAIQRKCRLRVHAWGKKESRPSRRMTFRRATGSGIRPKQSYPKVVWKIDPSSGFTPGRFLNMMGTSAQGGRERVDTISGTGQKRSTKQQIVPMRTAGHGGCSAGRLTSDRDGDRWCRART